MKTKILSKGIFFILFSLFFFGCSKEDGPDYFIRPSLEIESSEILSEQSCLIRYNIKKGNGSNLTKIYLRFEEISDSSIFFTKEISIKNEKSFNDSIEVNMPNLYKDYRVKMIAESEKNVYKSNLIAVYFSIDYASDVTRIVDYLICEPLNYHMYVYCDEAEDVGYVARPGEMAVLRVYCLQPPSEKLQYDVKLDGKIPVEFTFSNSKYTSYYTCDIIIPKDIESGIYNVHLYVSDGKKTNEHISIRKIKIIANQSTFISFSRFTDFNPHYHDFSTMFLLGDKMFFIFRNMDQSSPTIVRAYNLEKKSWEKKNDIVFPTNYEQFSSVENLTFKYNNEQYVVIDHVHNYDSFNEEMSFKTTNKIFKYNEINDTWTFITDFPGKGHMDFYHFVLNDCLYIGSERYNEDFFVKDDFWEYNFQHDKWTKKNNLPAGMIGRIMSSTDFDNNGFIIADSRQLWKYSPLSDSWIKLSDLKGGYKSRSESILLSTDKTIYLIGGKTLDTGISMNILDIWEYNVVQDTWTLKALYDKYTYMIGNIAFYYKNKIAVNAMIYDSNDFCFNLIEP